MPLPIPIPVGSENVCAIILDYFGAVKTQQCVLSLVGQRVKTVYILDNSASEHASSKLAENVANVIDSNPGFEIKILKPTKNLGFGRGVNFVLSYDRQSALPHDYYLLLNNDAIAGPNLITTMLAEFNKDASVSLVAPRVVSNEPGREFGIWYHRYFGLLLSRAGCGRFHYFTGCCLLLSRDLITPSGIFDESFFMYGEDAELGWRLTRLGKKTICASNAFVMHEYGPSIDRASFFYEYHMTRGHLLLTSKTSMHPIEIPFLLFLKLMAITVRATVRCCRHRTFTPIYSLLVAWLPLRVDKI